MHHMHIASITHCHTEGLALNSAQPNVGVRQAVAPPKAQRTLYLTYSTIYPNEKPETVVEGTRH